MCFSGRFEEPSPENRYQTEMCLLMGAKRPLEATHRDVPIAVSR